MKNPLNPQEQLNIMKLGAVMELQRQGIDIEEFDKQAQDSGFLNDTFRILVGASIITGVPLGIMLHNLGQKVRADRLDERELIEKAKYYRNISDTVRNELTAKNPVPLTAEEPVKAAPVDTTMANPNV